VTGKIIYKDIKYIIGLTSVWHTQNTFYSLFQILLIYFCKIMYNVSIA
jgi:hypothetical protein